MSYLQLNLQERADFVLKQLKEDYPKVNTPLYHSNAFELLIAVMLSPQTNDDITNKVLPVLFDTYPTPELLSSAKLEDVQSIINVVNYYKTKSQRIIDASNSILNKFKRTVPYKMSELLKIKGVGRKVANVVINDWYSDSDLVRGKSYKSNEFDSIERGSIVPEGIVVDTHVKRVSTSLLLSKGKSPDLIEKDLMNLFDYPEWPSLSLRMIFHGREVFQAKNPQYKKHHIWNMVYSDLLNIC